jgi:Flp pilus assembly protein TadG
MKPDIHSWLSRLRHGETAQVLILVAVLLPVLIGFTGLAIDVGLLIKNRTDRQRTADAAAIAGAQYLMYNPGDASTAKTTACDLASKNGADTTGCPTSGQVKVNIPPLSGPNITTPGAVEVVINKTDPTYFLRVLGQNEATVAARAVANSKPRKANYALVILDPSVCDAFSTSSNITITGGGAIVNSTAKTGSNCIGESAIQNGGSIITAQTCLDSTGVAIQCTLDYNPQANWTIPNNSTASPTPTKAPPFPDPLSCPDGTQAHVGEDYCPRPIPCSQTGTPTNCVPASTATEGTPNNPKLFQPNCSGGEVILTPGSYYGGIKLSASSCVFRFMPGIYVLAGSDHNSNAGGFSYTSGNICGLRTVADPPTYCPVAVDVTIFNTGNPWINNSNKDCSSMDITGSGVLKLAAPTVRHSASGVSPLTLAGYKNMLFWQDDSCTTPFRFAGSSSGQAWTQSGLMYFPQAGMQVTGGGSFGSVQVIAKTFNQGGGQTITINFSRYVNTDTQQWKLTE